MNLLLPHLGAAEAVSDDELSDIYAYPQALQAPYVRVNVIMSVNGAGTVDGLTAGLGSPGDLRVYEELRQLADVVLVGAGTVRTERYSGVKLTPELRSKRVLRGAGEVPPLAVVTRSADLDPNGPLLLDTAVPPIIFTTESAPMWRRERLRDAGAEVIVVGEQRAETSLILRELAARGRNKVLCEGGPRLFGQMVNEGAVDELCLSLSPHLVGGADPVIAGLSVQAQPMRLDSLLVEDDYLFLKYRRSR